jgi:hypothetical protein
VFHGHEAQLLCLALRWLMLDGTHR